MPDTSSFDSACPMPQSHDAERITLAYGEGGRLSRTFVRDWILARFQHPSLHALGDAARMEWSSSSLAFTTDSYTVTPLVFPGGDIGKLAVCGTVNDLAVAGARPRWLSLALMIEEGLPWQTLREVLDCLQQTAAAAGVAVVTGDTKVVPRGSVDRLFITTAGIGEMGLRPPSGPQSLQVGDAIVVSGPIGQHGAAILCARDELGFDPAPVSDCGLLHAPLLDLQAHQIPVRATRDATRGGVAAVLHEWTEASGLAIDLDEARLPVSPEVRVVCELLGLDPLFLACEGTFVAAIAETHLDEFLSVLRQHAISQAATVVGHVVESRSTAVCVRRATGRLVPLDEPAGSPLPRIC